MAEVPGNSLQDFSEEALCSVCLEYFKDPVITECGHNFCRACLARCWEEGSGGEEVSCPQCREKVRANFIPNRQLANFVELTRKLTLRGEKSAEGKGGVCGKHQEPLKLFCKEDEAPICVVCDRSKEHRNHDVVPLEEAAQDYKDQICHRVELLKEEREKRLACKAETEGKVQDLFKQTDAEMEKAKEQFRDLHSFLNKQEKLLLARLEEVQKEIARNRDEQLARLSEELCSLGGLIQEMEQKCLQPPGELLQDVRSILQRSECVRETLRPPSRLIPKTRCHQFYGYEKKKQFQKRVVLPTGLTWRIRRVCDRNKFLAEKMKQFKLDIASCDMEGPEEEEWKSVPSPRSEWGTGKSVEGWERTPKELDVQGKGAEQLELEATAESALWVGKEKEKGQRGVNQLRQEKEVEASDWAQEEKEAECFEAVKEKQRTGGQVIFKLPRVAAERERNSKKAPNRPFLYNVWEARRRARAAELKETSGYSSEEST